MKNKNNKNSKLPWHEHTLFGVELGIILFYTVFSMLTIGFSWLIGFDNAEAIVGFVITVIWFIIARLIWVVSGFNIDLF
jgi:hypothetical protein